MGAGSLAYAQALAPSINLLELDGTNGFAISMPEDVDNFGMHSYGVGDINGDGIEDLVVGFPSADGVDPNPDDSSDYENAGLSYVVFGGTGLGSAGLLDISSLDGSNGFVIEGIEKNDSSGFSVNGAGDVNGDGVGDIIIGAVGVDQRSYDKNGERVDTESANIGASYVVFGGAGVGGEGSLALSSLNGSNGFTFFGINTNDRAGELVTGVGDVNGDGFDDVLIGAPYASPKPEYSGQAYLVFGGVGVGEDGPVDPEGANGVVLNGSKEATKLGRSISKAGDINGDGFDDVIIGGLSRGAGSYVVFGRAGFEEDDMLQLSELDGDNGFVIRGPGRGEYAGISVSGGGDINGDGIPDLVISASAVEYVVFGVEGLGRGGVLELSSLNGANGFVISRSDGGTFNDSIIVGDVNGDGVSDIVVGAEINSRSEFISGFLVFGGASVGSSGSLDVSKLNAEQGIVLDGLSRSEREYDRLVSGIAAGDVNGDGIDDIVVNAFSFEQRGGNVFVRKRFNSYVVFGNADISVTPVEPVPPVVPTGTPANDQFANAEMLGGASQALASGSTFTINGTTVDATVEKGEPTHRKSVSGRSFGPRNSIWYSWSADKDQVVEIDTVGSEVGTALAAYTGDTLPALNTLAQAIDNRDRITRIRFAARAGETYHFAIDGYGKNSEGAVQLNVRQPTMDPNECTITGTDGPDELKGTTGADVICGLGGADKITALGGADIIFAGSGHDFVSAGGGMDLVFGEDGNDLLVGGSGSDLLSGGSNSDRLFGGKGSDIIFGGQGADRLFGAAGNDALFGQTGKDRLFGGEDNDLLDGGKFDDICADKDGKNKLVGC